MTQSKSQKSSNRPINPADLRFCDLTLLHKELRNRGCCGCILGKQKNLMGPVLFKGNPEAKIMVIGEAPGKMEDYTGKPFSGPAGEWLDKIFAAIGLDINKDCYICNCICCRPIAPYMSGKQNNTPKSDEIKACWPFLDLQIMTVQPKVIVLAGMTAVKRFFKEEAIGKIMAQFVGKEMNHPDYPDICFFPIYHPAVIPHSQNDPKKQLFYRTEMWKHMQALKEILVVKNIAK